MAQLLDELVFCIDDKHRVKCSELVSLHVESEFLTAIREGVDEGEGSKTTTKERRLYADILALMRRFNQM